MDINEWWGLVERARHAAGDQTDDRDPADAPLPGALTLRGRERGPRMAP
jgi:hypothetical protein